MPCSTVLDDDWSRVAPSNSKITPLSHTILAMRAPPVPLSELPTTPKLQANDWHTWDLHTPILTDQYLSFTSC